MGHNLAAEPVFQAPVHHQAGPQARDRRHNIPGCGFLQDNLYLYYTAPSLSSSPASSEISFNLEMALKFILFSG